MKKAISAISLILAILMIAMCFASCGGGSDDDDDSDRKSSSKSTKGGDVSGAWEDEDGNVWEFKDGIMYDKNGDEAATYETENDTITLNVGSYTRIYTYEVGKKEMSFYMTNTFTKTESEYEDESDKSKIAGAWEDEDGDVWIFANGTMYDEDGDEAATYEISGDTLKITTTSYYYGTTTTEYTFKAKLKTLTLTTLAQSFKKVASTSASTESTTEKTTESTSSNPGNFSGKGIEGTWTDAHGSKVEFKNGKMYKYGMEWADYEITGDEITLDYYTYSDTYTYSLSGDTLTFYDTVKLTKTTSEYEDPSDTSLLAGAWVDEEGEVWTFANGTLYDYDGYEEATCEISGNTLTLTSVSYYGDVETQDYTFKLSGNTLTLTCESEIFTKAN